MDGTIWKVRCADYATTHEKIRSQPNYCRLLCVDLFKSDARISHIAARPECVLPKLKEVNTTDMAFLLVINLQIAGNVSIVSYLAVPKSARPEDGAVSSLCQRLRTETDEWRDSRMKLLPHIEEGGFLIRKAVGTTPCIIGTKGESAYFSVTVHPRTDV